jgi:Nuclease-related domain
MASIEIFIGAPIEHASERAALARAVEFLTAQGISAVIIANVNLKTRQIDLLIALDQGVLVVEAKAFASMMRGGENGLWELRLASGRWKRIPNAYRQTIDEKLALRDAMAEFAGGAVPYPDAALVFTPAIPAGSSIPPSDFKVTIGGIGELPTAIQSVKRHGWSFDQWRAFAKHHQLVPVSSVEAALSPVLLDAELLLTAYGEAFADTYGAPAAELVAISCQCESELQSSDAVLERSGADSSVLLVGPSGCGKTLLSYKMAIAALARGCVPIILPAKDFEGSLRDVANREATLLGAPSAQAILSAARRLDRQLLLVVDGYNECTPAERQRLTRSMAAAVKRYDAQAVLSSQSPLERDDLLPARIYAVQQPDKKAKLTIARQVAGVGSDILEPLLDTVGSGLEAKMVGQLGPRLPIGASRYGLFDAYVRERLGSAASDGIRALSRIAGMMTDRVSFGLSVRELDRLSDREGVSGTLLQTLRGSNILQTRGDRVSFSHEMFLNVFAAEAIVRRSNGDAEAVVAALRLPQHIEVRPLVLGAIDDDTVRRQVLLQQSDARTIRACLAGQCGRDAQLWANQRIDEVLGRLDEEIERVAFEIEKEKAFFGIRAKSGTIRDWSAEDRAVLDAIPYGLMTGYRLDEVLRLIGKMDQRLVEEHRRLRGEAEEQKVALRSGLYAACYVSRGWENFGLARICVPVQSGGLYSEPAVAADVNLLGRLASDSLSPGQVGLLIGLNRYADRKGPSIAGVLPSLLSRYWPYAAYHLRLELMEAAAFGGHSMTEDERLASIAAIEALPPAQHPFISTAIVDALKALGALDDDQAEYVETVKGMIAEALADQSNPLMWDIAVGLWNGQFDHPYDGAYWEAWNDLSPTDRKALLVMAAQSIENESMFVPSLIGELASHADPAVGTLIARWTGLPPTKQVMMHDAIRDFEMAHAALARLRCPPADRPSEMPSAAGETLLACGDLLYWLNRDDLPLTGRKLKCAAPLSVLSRHDAGVAAAVMGEFFRSDMMFSESARRLPGSEPVITSFGQVFPDQVAAIYRAALENQTIQTGYFDFFRIEDVIEKALSILGHFGDASDIRLLRLWSVHPDFGRSAIQAIKEIEEAPHNQKLRASG